MNAPECDVCFTANTYIENRYDKTIRFRCFTCNRDYFILPEVHKLKMNPVKNKKELVENKDEIEIGRSSSSGNSGLGIFPGMPYPLELMMVTEMMSASMDSSSDCSSSDSSTGSSGDF